MAEAIETSASIEESQNDLDFTLQTNNEKATLQKNDAEEIFDHVETLKPKDTHIIDKPNTSETFENQPFLIRQPLENNSMGTFKGSESSNTSRNIMIDPNEISFNKDQFNFLFNKDSVSEKDRAHRNKTDILVVDQKIEEENLSDLSHVKRELESSGLHETEGSQNNLSTKESIGHNQLEKKLYLSEKMLYQNSHLIIKLQEENMVLKEEVSYLKGENELIKENLVILL